MGGWGSGSYLRSGSKRKAEDSLPLSIYKLRQEDLLVPGQGFSYEWSVGGNVYSTIGAQVFKDHLMLIYRHKGEDTEQRINFTWTDCNYGNKRIWFQCPDCGRRCAVIYSRGQYFSCRKCCGVVYKSTSETVIDRKLRRANKLRRKIGGIPGPANDLPIFKPKGMHQKTWDRIRIEIYSLELPFWNKAGRWLGTMEQKTNKIAKRLGVKESY